MTVWQNNSKLKKEQEQENNMHNQRCVLLSILDSTSISIKK